MAVVTPAGGRDPYDPAGAALDERASRRRPGRHRRQSVLAAGDGTVTFAGQVGGKTVVSIRHTPALWTTYEPVGPQGSRGRRSPARGRDRHGHRRTRGCPVAACLHWGARTGAGPSGGYRNPLGLVGALRVRLYPVP